MSKKVKDTEAYEENATWAVAEVNRFIGERDEELLRNALHAMRDKQGQLTRLVDLFSSLPTQFLYDVSSNITVPGKIKVQFDNIAEIIKSRFFAAAVIGLKKGEKNEDNKRLRKRLAAAVGAAGGAWWPALPGDILLSSGLMLREIASVAQEEGYDLTDPRTVRACWEIYMLREELSSKEAGKAHIVPSRALLRGRSLGFLVTDIIGRYGISVSRHTLQKMFPVAGALCGASLNMAFMDQYRAMARIYFIMERLKTVHGEAALEEFKGNFA